MELLPCPFCGGEATFDHDDNGWNWISCGKCGATTDCRTHTMEDCHRLLAEQWNRRVIPLHEMIGDCRKQFDDWWSEFTSAHEDWRFADSDALRWQAWQAAWNLRASPASAPEGFALVPVVPTHAILDVMFNAGIDMHDVDLTLIYRAMLAAAPAPPVSEDRKDAERYRWLRSQQIDLNAPRIGVLRSGIFVGKIPDNVVLSEADADAEIDAAMEGK